MAGSPVVVGISDHSGWAWLISVGLAEGKPRIIDRRRVETLDQGLPNQPHHHEAVEISLPEAEALVARVKASAFKRSKEAIEALASDLAPDHKIAGIARRSDPARAIPETVAEIMESHPAMHAADGVLYRRAFDLAADDLGIPVSIHQRKEELFMAAAAMGMDPESFDDFLKETGKEMGAPWQKEHRVAFADAVIGLMSPD